MHVKAFCWLATAFVAVAVVGCYQPVSKDYSATASTPDSTLSRVERSSSEPFNFETLVPVRLDVEVAYYGLDGKAATDQAPSIVTVLTAAGSQVYEGSARPDEGLRAPLSVPISEEVYRIIVEKPGYERASFDVERPSELARIEIKAHLQQARSIGSQVAGDADTDKDGIPDVYDADPIEDSIAFSSTTPPDGQLTVAYEDNFPRLGDGDYNDFLASYTVTTSSDTDNRVVEVTVDATARAKVAGYNHEFGFVVEFPGLTGLLTAYYGPADGSDTRYTAFRKTVTNRAQVTLFDSTAEAVSSLPTYAAFFSITSLEPIDENNPPDPWVVSPAPLDPYLYIHNTTYDVHLIGKPKLDGTNNPPETFDWDFRDQAGYPRALLVPTDWGHPRETLHIEEAYPDFRTWRESEGEEATDWYLNPDPDQVVYPPSP